MAKSRKGDPPRRPALPQLPPSLQEIFECSVPTPTDPTALIGSLNSHARKLVEFLDELQGWAMDKTNLRKTQDRSGLSRELQGALTSSGLRQRICVLSDLCACFKSPPTPDLLDLMFFIDGPAGILAADGV